jgi:hypothetical protein
MTMLFANQRDLHSKALILSATEAARQRAARRIKARLARDAAARLLAVRQQPFSRDR